MINKFIKIMVALYKWMFARGYVIGYEGFSRAILDPISANTYRYVYGRTGRYKCVICGRYFYSRVKQGVCWRLLCRMKYELRNIN